MCYLDTQENSAKPGGNKTKLASHCLRNLHENEIFGYKEGLLQLILHSY